MIISNENATDDETETAVRIRITVVIRRLLSFVPNSTPGWKARGPAEFGSSQDFVQTHRLETE
jgi:hypothetical protein